jgi:hypothetical protein
VALSKPQVNRHWKQFCGGYKTHSYLICNSLSCDCLQFLLFLLSPNPILTSFCTLTYIPFLSYRHSLYIHPVAIHSVPWRYILVNTVQYLAEHIVLSWKVENKMFFTPLWL